MQLAASYLCEKDDIFKNIIEKYGLPAIHYRPHSFESLVLVILEQQVSINSAMATFLKLKKKVKIFSPINLFTLNDENYKEAGVSRQKTRYIIGLSKAITEKQLVLENLSTMTVEQIREELIKIKGIGNWTIDVYLMLCLQAQDIIPLGDMAVINTIKELLNIVEKHEIEQYTKLWQPHRSAATFLLWHYYLRKRNRTLA